MNAPGPLGWIPFGQRDKAMNDAHADSLAKMIRFTAPPIPTGPVNVRLFDAWKHPDVVADCDGVTFDRFHQITGSCVGAGGGNALFTLIATQRLFADSPTKAFIPWWPHPYGKSRLRAGMKNPGEGSLGSTFADALTMDGVIDAANPQLPKFSQPDGLMLTQQLEIAWSDGDSGTVTPYDSLAREHPLGTAAELHSVADIRAAIINGYPVTVACNNYIGSARVEGSGADACLIGSWDSYGPHQQSIHAVWDHPQFGPLYWGQNNWPKSVYPRDPAGGPVCGCWVREANVEKLWRLDPEIYALSHLTWFPAQPKVLDWSQI